MSAPHPVRRTPKVGVALVVVAAFWGALFLIPFKAASQDASRPAIVLAVVLCAALLNTAVALVRLRGRPRVDRVAWVTAGQLALCTAAGNIGIAGSLERVEPAITSVVLQTQVILVGLLELILLRTRPTLALIIGSVLALAGFLVMRAPWEAAAAADPAGVAWALLAASSFALMLVLTRRVIERIDAVTVNALRLWLATAAMAVWPGAVVAVAAFDLRLWLLCAAAAACGLTISRLLLMQAVRYITATETKLVGLIAPLFALGLGVAFFGVWPTGQELLGGAVILGGVALPLAMAEWRKRRRAPTTALPPTL